MALTVNNTNLITEAVLQAHPGCSGITDAQAQVLIPLATSRIKRFLGRHRLVCTQADVTIYLDGEGSRDLWLPDGPLTAITSLTDDLNRNFTSGAITIDDDNLMIYGGYVNDTPALSEGNKNDFPTKIRLLGDADCFSKGSLNIKFVGRVGYNDENDDYLIPDELEEACRQLCAFLHFVSPTPGIKSQRTQTYSYTREEIKRGMPDTVRMLLEPYRRRFV